jgi:hypothetical protein
VLSAASLVPFGQRQVSRLACFEELVYGSLETSDCLLVTSLASLRLAPEEEILPLRGVRGVFTPADKKSPLEGVGGRTTKADKNYETVFKSAKLTPQGENFGGRNGDKKTKKLKILTQ